MKNTKVGNIIIGISILILIVFSVCSISINILYEKSILLTIQSILGILIFLLILLYGIKIKLTKEITKIPKIKVEKEKKEINTSNLNKEEKEIIKILKKEKEILQSKLMVKIKVNKVKMTRLLKKLEEKEIIFKKKSGMNNLVVLN